MLFLLMDVFFIEMGLFWVLFGIGDFVGLYFGLFILLYCMYFLLEFSIKLDDLELICFIIIKKYLVENF